MATRCQTWPRAWPSSPLPQPWGLTPSWQSGRWRCHSAGRLDSLPPQFCSTHTPKTYTHTHTRAHRHTLGDVLPFPKPGTFPRLYHLPPHPHPYTPFSHQQPKDKCQLSPVFQEGLDLATAASPAPVAKRGRNQGQPLAEPHPGPPIQEALRVDNKSSPDFLQAQNKRFFPVRCLARLTKRLEVVVKWGFLL